MQKIAILALALTLSACSAGGQPHPLPSTPVSTPTWLMIPGTWAEYTSCPMTGKFEAGKGMTFWKQEVCSPEFRITNLALGAQIGRVYGDVGVEIRAVPQNLQGVLVEGRDGNRVGEIANVVAKSILPPEPLISANPVQGEEINTVSLVNGVGGFPTWYKTLAVDESIGGFDHATETVLVERPGEAGQIVYQHLFVDGEIAQICFGPVASDGSVVGDCLRRVRVGKNSP